MPHFIHLKSDAKAYRKMHGDPDSESWFRCCTDNIYLPMHEYITKNHYRQVMRGTKAIDPHIHTVFPGDMLDGVLFTFPLWFWTDVDVMIYLGDSCRPSTASVRWACPTASLHRDRDVRRHHQARVGLHRQDRHRQDDGEDALMAHLELRPQHPQRSDCVIRALDRTVMLPSHRV